MRRWFTSLAAAFVVVGLLAVSPSAVKADDGPFQLLGNVSAAPQASVEVTPVRWGYGYGYRPYYRYGYGYRPYSGYYRPYYGGYRGYYGGYGGYGGYYRPGFGFGVGIY